MNEFTICANAARCPLRKYKPRCGESWDDVMKRAKQFFIMCADFGFRGKIENIFDKEKIFEKVLAVTHGGFVMEAINYIKMKMNGDEPGIKNVTKNCSLTIVRMTCKRNEGQGGICDSRCGEGKDDCLEFELLVVNDTSHIQEHKEEVKRKKEEKKRVEANNIYKKKIGSLVFAGLTRKGTLISNLESKF